MTKPRWIWGLALSALGALSTPAWAQNATLFSASSRAQGASFDLVVTETRRLPGKSELRVPGFHERTAAGSRWLMCIYADLAKMRGFTHWVVLYPALDDDRLVVGLSNKPQKSRAVLGAEFDAARVLDRDDMLIPVAAMHAMCSVLNDRGQVQEPVQAPASAPAPAASGD